MKTTGLLIATILLLSSCVDVLDETRIDPRERITGVYDVEEFSTTYGDETFYRMDVYENRYSRTQVYLDNFYGADIRVVAEVYDNRIEIPLQVVRGFEVRGSGSYFRGELELFYTVRDLYNNSYSDRCETIAFRR